MKKIVKYSGIIFTNFIFFMYFEYIDLNKIISIIIFNLVYIFNLKMYIEKSDFSDKISNIFISNLFVFSILIANIMIILFNFTIRTNIIINFLICLVFICFQIFNLEYVEDNIIKKKKLENFIYIKSEILKILNKNLKSIDDETEKKKISNFIDKIENKIVLTDFEVIEELYEELIKNEDNLMLILDRTEKSYISL